MRLLDYTSLAVKDLGRQKVRSSLTIIALVISTLILVVMAAISLGGQRAIISQYGSSDSLTSISVTPNQNNGSLSPFGTVQQVNDKAQKLTDGTVATLMRIPNVASASPRAAIWEIRSFAIENSDKQFVAHVEGVASDGAVPLVAGGWFASNDTKNAAVIGAAYAKELGYGNNPSELIGKTLRLTSQKGYRGEVAALPLAGASKEANEAFNQSETVLTATITGVTQEGPDQNSVLIPMGWAHGIRTARFNEPTGEKRIDQLERDGYTTVKLTVNDVSNVKAVSEAVTAQGYGQISTLAQVEKLQQFSTTMWVILGAVALIAVIAAALGVANTMLMAVSEQRYTIGVWRAVGARRGVIVRLFLVQAAALGLIGGIIGVGLGIVVGRYVNDYVAGLLSGQGLAASNIALFPAWLLAGAVLLTTLFGILAGLYPAYKAARQDPSAALSGGQ